jgi:hypothetical protein
MALTITQQIAGCTMTRAMMLARGMVRAELKKQRIRLADTDAKDIASQARAMLEAHPSLVDQARHEVEEWFRRGVFGKRAQRAFCANLKTDTQTQKAQSIGTSVVQISCSE